jgi:Xaa-Pro aminopeptidase
MAEEIKRAIEIKDGKAVMITTTTRVDVAEQAVDTKKLEGLIGDYTEMIDNSERRIIDITNQLNEEITKLEKDVIRFTAERAEMQKQLDAYKLIEKDLPKDEEDIKP